MAKRKKIPDMFDVMCCPPSDPSIDFEPMPSHDPQHLVGYKSSRWGGEGVDKTDDPDTKVRELHVRFLEPFDAVVAGRIASIVAGPFGWNSVCGMQFVFDQAEDAEIRIAFAANEGSWSHVGTDALGIAVSKPTMNFGWLHRDTNVAEYHRVVLHEFGHALGFVHEHQSPYFDIPWDYDKVYAYYRKKDGWSKATVDHNVLRRFEEKYVDATEGDPKSIMCYLIDPLFLTDPMLNIGGNTELSELDKQKASEWYGPPTLRMYFPIVLSDSEWRIK